jgi:hypothetical protein
MYVCVRVEIRFFCVFSIPRFIPYIFQTNFFSMRARSQHAVSAIFIQNFAYIFGNFPNEFLCIFKNAFQALQTLSGSE